jgi:hypothetical protein
VNDLGIKAMQWRSLQVENDELLQVVAKLTVAQNQLLAKDPITQARIEASARKASEAAAERQKMQGELLREYYKDKPRAIQLAVRQAAARGPEHASQIAQGISIVDADFAAQDLAGIPGINPDFIESLKRCNQTVANAWTRQGYLDAMNCNKYPDGSYINIMGPSRAPKSSTAQSKPSLPPSADSASATASSLTPSAGPASASGTASTAGNARIRTQKDTTWGGGRIYVKVRQKAENGLSPGVIVYCDPMLRPCVWSRGCDNCDFDLSQLPPGTTGLTLAVCLKGMGSVQDWKLGDAFPETREAKAEGKFCVPAFDEHSKPDLTYQIPIPKAPNSIYVDIR